MSRNYQVVLASALVLGAWSVAGAQEGNQPAKAAGKKAAAQPVCPISGKAIDKKVSIGTDGDRVYFCCPGCIKKYKADPDKYADKVHLQQMLMGPPRVQVACPVSGKAIDKAISIDHHGRKIYFCCPKCPKKFEKDPGKYLKNLNTAFTTQVLCPVSGEDIDPAVWLSLSSDEERVYFCCEKCRKKFTEDRVRYGAKLASFYLCPMKVCQDTGSFKPSDCPKCGMHRKQIGLAAKTQSKGRKKKAAGESGHEGHEHEHEHGGHEHDHSGHEHHSPM